MAPASADSVNTHMTFTLAVMANLEDIKVNWEQVAAENGIGYARNAASKFKDLAKKYGYKFENNKVVKVDDGNSNNPPATASASATPKTPKTSRAPATPQGKSVQAGGGAGSATKNTIKKRKAVQVADDDDDDDEHPVKKVAKEESEDDAEGTEA